MMPRIREQPARGSRAPFSLTRQQTFSRDLDEVFAFFADYKNLELITPPWLRFRILGASRPEMSEGMTIDYRLKVHGLPIRWRSLVSEWDPPYSFVDQQVAGPYKVWIHRHTFEPTEAGVLVTDRVDYAVPGGRLIERLFVRRDLERIFDFRREQLIELLG